MAAVSFRISESVKACLTARAGREGVTATALLEQLITEGVGQREYPGIVFRGPAHDRRAGLAVGPDVWEIVGRLRELDGDDEHRIGVLSEETDLHPRFIRIAIGYAADHADDIMRMIKENEAAQERSRAAVERREAILA
jgi:hypothetical protein